MLKTRTMKECFDEWVKFGRKKDYGHDFSVHEIRLEFFQHRMKIAERMYCHAIDKMSTQLREWQKEFPEYAHTYEALIQKCELSQFKKPSA